MAHTFGKKVHLLVDFLLGARLAETNGPLGDLGWTAETMERGWTLVETAGSARYSEKRLAADRTDAELNAFKKRWFSLARILLERRSPEVAARLLGNGTFQTQQTAAFVVEPFLRVLRELETSADATDREARQLLAGRGLTPEVAAEGARLVDQAHRVISTKTPESLLAAEQQAEKELWDFYQEWSALARRSIKNRNLLRLLGLNKIGRPARSPERSEPTVHVFASSNVFASAPAPRLPAAPETASEENDDSKKSLSKSATEDRSGRNGS